MTRMNLGEMKESALFISSKSDESTTLNSNETAKREMATELKMQGFSEAAICRILNISPDQLPDYIPS